MGTQWPLNAENVNFKDAMNIEVRITKYEI